MFDENKRDLLELFLVSKSQIYTDFWISRISGVLKNLIIEICVVREISLICDSESRICTDFWISRIL